MAEEVSVNEVEHGGKGRDVAFPPRLDRALARDRPGLVCYVPLGDPLVPEDLPTALLGAGADVLEVGVPAADPRLDGPVVAGSMRRARAAGVGHHQAADLMAALRGRVGEHPMVWMGYPEHQGTRWASTIAESGVDAVLLAEAPRRLGGPRRWLSELGVPLLCFLDLELDPADVALAAAATSGYVMLQAVPGRTGVRAGGSDPRLPGALVALRRAGVRVPLAVGFGVAGAEAARHLVQLGADAVVIGSAVLEAALEGSTKAAALIAEVRKALDAG